MHNIKIISTATLFLSIFLFSACTFPHSPDQPTDGKIRVVASFYPLAEFARQVGGNGVSVTTIISAGTEPHDFEPTPQDIARIQESRLFIYNGGTLDPWAGKIASELPSVTPAGNAGNPSSGVKTLNMAQALGLGGADPHFWLDPSLAQKEVTAIREALIQADPARAETYRQNADAYSIKLSALDLQYSRSLAACASREIFTSHAAFSYLARKYNLIQSSIAGLSPDAEPSARQLAELADSATAKKIKYIFFETLASPKLAETLATATRAQTLVLNPLEGLTADEVKSGRDYISVMQDNLKNLVLALNCK